jgi:ATP-binding cassette subfamily B multidrug efflux pump
MTEKPMDTEPTENDERGDASGPVRAGGDSAPRLSFKEHLRWIWRYWQPHKYILVFLAFFTLISTAVAVAYPLVLRAVLDRVTGIFEAEGEAADIRTVMLILAAILVGHFVARLYPATRAMVNARLERDIRDDVFGDLMQKDYHFGNAFRTGDVVTRLTDDIAEWPKVAWFACSGIFRAVESSSKLVFCLVTMIVLSGKLTALSVLPLPVMMWIFYGLRHKMRYYMEQSQKSVSKTNNLLESAFTGVRIVKAFSAEEAQGRRLSGILRERLQILVGLIKLEVVMFSLDTFASRLGQMVIIAYGGYLVIGGELTIGTLFAFYVYLDMLTGPMMDVPFLFMTGQQAFVSIDRVEQIRAFPVTEPRPSGPALEGIGEIVFEGVTFSYDGSRNNLEGVDFRVPRGRKVAVVGPVASGKSTVLKLIAGILAPQDGRILINGRPLGEWDWDSFRALVGYVPQEAFLFSKSIKENVTLGRAAPDEESVRADAGLAPSSGSELPTVGSADPVRDVVTLDQADRSAERWARGCLSVAQMDSDLAILPDGVDTVVGQKGALVSGGQRQRIAIARALAGSPEVLLLDDCTAALDAQNEDRFWAHLDDTFAGRTCFIVSHRLSTIRRADTILVLKNGRLVDQGPHQDLVARCETYREFLQTEQRKAHLGMAA